MFLNLLITHSIGRSITNLYIMSMEGFEPRISGMGSDRFATCATRATAYQKLDFQKLERIFSNLM